MQNPARNSKIGNSETETIFVSHMSEWIFKKKYDGKQQCNYNFYQNTYTVENIEKIFCQ